MAQAMIAHTSVHSRGLLGGVLAFDRWLKGPIVCWIAAPIQLLLRIYIFFFLPFVNSGLTKFDTFPFLKPEGWVWNGWPQLSASAKYQFSNICDFCFNIRIWGTSEEPLVQWMHPFPETSASLAGSAEIILPSLILIGFLTRLSAVGLLGMTVVIQLVLPEGWPVHATWTALFIAAIILGPGVLSADHLLGRLFRR